jgi:PKD domain-containing protein
MNRQMQFVVWASALALSACAGGPEDGDKEMGAETEQAVTATTQQQDFASALSSSSQPIASFPIDGFEPASLTVFHLHVNTEARWLANLTTRVTWDSDKVRQGQTLDITRDPLFGNGTLKVRWTLTGTLEPLGLFSINIGTIPLDVDSSACAINLDAGDPSYDCTAESFGFPLVFTPGIPLSPYVDLTLHIKFTINPNTGAVTRAMLIGDFEQLAAADLDLPSDAQTESTNMPCGRPAGDEALYTLDPVKWSPASVATLEQPAFSIGLMDPFLGVVKLPAIFDAPFGPGIPGAPDFHLEGAGDTIDLGPLLANNVPPTIAPLGPFSGQEGSPVSFHANVTSQCPITSLVWSFSDGTQSFGPTPQRAFQDDGVFDGELKVTDQTNLSATGDFTVSISNRPPVANAGPDTSGAWNRPIEFHGQAVDPGADDQATLVYTWDWGDGTPGTGGADAIHAYQLPGDYIARLTVCDDHTCDADTANVHVRRRATLVSYTGTNTGVFSSTATIGGSIIDEFGQPVNGGTLQFTLGGNPAGNAATDATGNASRVVDVDLVAGTYAVSASFGGTSLYDGGASSAQFAVTRMPSTVTYTGAVSGGPNKTVAVTAKLTDALGRPLDGKVIVFTLGTQTASATTANGGIASTTIKLNQHNGSYALTSVFTPAGGDASKYFGATNVTTFIIGNKLTPTGTVSTSYSPGIFLP